MSPSSQLMYCVHTSQILVPTIPRHVTCQKTIILTKLHTRAVQWKTGKVVLKIACKTDVIVCRVCEGGDPELPIDGVGMPVTCIGTWETVRQDGGPLQQCTKQEQQSVVRFLLTKV